MAGTGLFDLVDVGEHNLCDTETTVSEPLRVEAAVPARVHRSSGRVVWWASQQVIVGEHRYSGGGLIVGGGRAGPSRWPIRLVLRGVARRRSPAPRSSDSGDAEIVDRGERCSWCLHEGTHHGVVAATAARPEGTCRDCPLCRLIDQHRAAGTAE